MVSIYQRLRQKYGLLCVEGHRTLSLIQIMVDLLQLLVQNHGQSIVLAILPLESKHAVNELLLCMNTGDYELKSG